MGGRFRKTDDKEDTSGPSTLINFLRTLPFSGHGSFPTIHVDTPTSSHTARPTASADTEMALDMKRDSSENTEGGNNSLLAREDTARSR